MTIHLIVKLMKEILLYKMNEKDIALQNELSPRHIYPQ